MKDEVQWAVWDSCYKEFLSFRDYRFGITALILGRETAIRALTAHRNGLELGVLDCYKAVPWDEQAQRIHATGGEL